MASSDFGGNGLGMRNGHAKLTRAIAKEKSPPTRKGRPRESEAHAAVASDRRRTRPRRSAPRAACASSAA